MAPRVLGKASSINVRKVLWTCHELGLAVEREDWGSGFQPTDTPAFLALNPNAMVPVLVDDDFVLWESNTICRYLAVREGRLDLLGATPRERARVEQWMDWQATELNNSWRYVFLSRVRHSPAHQDPAALQAAEQGWARHMRMLDAQLARTGAFVTGDAFTLADVVLGLSVQRWAMTPMARPELEAVQGYFDRLCLREGFRRFGSNGLP
jgi:glutathione S-transferase